MGKGTGEENIGKSEKEGETEKGGKQKKGTSPLGTLAHRPTVIALAPKAPTPKKEVRRRGKAMYSECIVY